MLICIKIHGMRIYFIRILFLIVLFSGCARRGRPEGGPKDFDKPIMVKTDPEFKSLNFKNKEIKIYFDEFIKLQNVTTQLIVSPPLKYPPIISPQGTPSKKITIKIKDTLQDNTTYTFNFGQSIVDNTEGNILENFKYIFSTGDYIDSLEVKGTIKDAFDLEMIESPTMMLYQVNESFNDSIIFSEKPMYIGSTIDSLNWDITNIKAGKYLLVALNDQNKNYKFNPKDDKIGFTSKYITVPKDTSYAISLFNEILPFRLPTKPKEIAIGHIIIGYEGEAKGFNVSPISKINDDFKSVATFDKEKDTVHFWFKNYEKDSLNIEVSNNDFIDTLTVKFFAKKMDTLQLKSSASSVLHLRDTFKIVSNVPLSKIDTSKIYFVDKDSVQVPYTQMLSKDKLDMVFSFEKVIQERYLLELYPGAITDFYGMQNDSLKIQFRTSKVTSYGSLYLTLNNVKSYPIIIELINDTGKVVAKKYSDKNEEYQFINIIPSRFKIRIIYDTNKNKKWDTGNFLLKKQPEEVYYSKSTINVKANWKWTETLTLQ